MTSPVCALNAPAPALGPAARLGISLQLLGLALMIGGMLALGAITAPIVFTHYPRPEAAALMGILFRRYDRVLLGALGLLWGGQITLAVAMFRHYGGKIPKTCPAVAKLLLMSALTGGLLFSTLVVNPQIEALQRQGVHRGLNSPAGQRFDALHRRSEGVYKANLLMAVLLLLWMPFALPGLRFRRSADNPEAASGVS